MRFSYITAFCTAEIQASGARSDSLTTVQIFVARVGMIRSQSYTGIHTY